MRITPQHFGSHGAASRSAGLRHGAFQADGPPFVPCWKPALQRGGRAGFSLIEIMVAVSLLAVIIVGLLAMFYQVQRAFRAGTAQVDVMEGGRATLSVLNRELQDMSATYFDGATNFLVMISSGYAPYRQSLLNGERRDNALQDLTFMRRINDEWIGTAYRVRYADSGVGTLYRYVTNSFTPNPVYISLEISTTNLPPDPMLPTRTSPSSTNGFHPVLDGVVHFSVTVYDANGNLYPYYNPTNRGPYTVVGDNNVPRYTIAGDDAFGSAFTGSALPAFIDIELAVLEPATLEKFKYRAEAGVPAAKLYLSDKTSRMHVFRQRIPIRAAAADTGVDP